jgi:hypothetical protein
MLAEMDAPVVLLGPVEDPHLARVGAALDARGARVLVANSRAQPSGPRLSVGHDEVRVEGVTPRALLVRALPPRHPGFVVDAPLDREQRRQQENLGGATRDAWGAALEQLALDVPVLNPPRAGTFEQQKPLQLIEAAALGLRVPRWRVTNSPEAAASFAKEVGDAIRKPVRQGDVTRAFSAARADAVAEGAQLLQERVRGLNVRATLVDGRVVSAVRMAGLKALDYRADPAYQRGETRYEDVDLGAVGETLARLASRLGLRFVGVDLKEADGGLVFLEMNAAPAWLEIEDKTDAKITDAVADALLGSRA